jgi:hypothetical protein
VHAKERSPATRLARTFACGRRQATSHAANGATVRLEQPFALTEPPKPLFRCFPVQLSSYHIDCEDATAEVRSPRERASPEGSRDCRPPHQDRPRQGGIPPRLPRARIAAPPGRPRGAADRDPEISNSRALTARICLYLPYLTVIRGARKFDQSSLDGPGGHAGTAARSSVRFVAAAHGVSHSSPAGRGARIVSEQFVLSTRFVAAPELRRAAP